MSISGGVKWFYKSLNLFADGASMSMTTGGDSSNYALDKNPVTYARSVGSNDATVETWIVTFPDTVTISRILLLDHNFKFFTVKYDVAGVFTNFTSVVGLDGALGGGIAETVFADGTAYYEFASVSTTRLEIVITSTQVANAQKYLSQLICTNEIGTLQGYPVISPVQISKNSRNMKMLSGRQNVQKSEQTFAVSLSFENYPVSSTYTPDLDLMFTLFDSEDPFLIWLCGGRRGTTYFKYAARGFRLKDVIQVQIPEAIEPAYRENVYINPVNMAVQFVEHV